MKWRGQRQSTNVEDHTNDEPFQIPEGAPLARGGVYHRQKNSNVIVNRDIQFNPDDPKEMEVIRTLDKKKWSREGNPVPTPRPNNTKTHDNLVTPGKWKTKNGK